MHQKDSEFFPSRINIFFNINVDSSSGPLILISYLHLKQLLLELVPIKSVSQSSVNKPNLFQINNRGSLTSNECFELDFFETNGSHGT